MTTSSDSLSTQRSNTYRYIVGGVIVLMIVLMLFPINLTGRQSRGAASNSPLFGVTRDGVRVTVADRQYAAELLETLNRVDVGVGTSRGPLADLCWGPDVVAGFRKYPEALFVALADARNGPGASPLALGPLDADQRNAQDTGIFNSGFVLASQLRPLPEAPLGAALVQQPGQLLVSVQLRNASGLGSTSISLLSTAEQQVIYAALRDFLTIQSAADATAGAVKVSSPVVDRLIAERLQRITVRVAAYDATAHLEGVAEPTDEQLRKQFDAHAADAPGVATPSNPFGFGYRLPDRVKLEWLAIDRAPVRAAVEAEKSPYDWDVDTRVAYANDPASFAAATRPSATAPSATAPSATAPATTNPSFDDFKAAAVAQQIDRATDARIAEVERRVRAILSGDYQSWTATQLGAGATPTTSPAAGSVAAGDYLDRVADQVARLTKIRPEVGRLTDRFRSTEEIESDSPAFAALAHLSNLNDRRGIPNYEAAATYAVRAASTRPAEERGAEPVALYQPSATLTDALESRRAIFRVTAVDPAHAATDLAAVREQVRADVRIEQAFAAAAADAKQAADAWRNGTAPVPELKTAVLDRGNSSSNALDLVGPPLEQFYERGLDALLAPPAGGQPIVAVEVPLARRAFVARREAITPAWTSEQELASLRPEAAEFAARQMLKPRTPGNQLGLTEGGLAGHELDAKRLLDDRGWQPAAPDAR